MYRIDYQTPAGEHLNREVSTKDEANEVYQSLLFEEVKKLVVWESKTARAKVENDWVEVTRWELRVWVSIWNG